MLLVLRSSWCYTFSSWCFGLLTLSSWEEQTICLWRYIYYQVIFICFLVHVPYLYYDNLFQNKVRTTWRKLRFHQKWRNCIWNMHFSQYWTTNTAVSTWYNLAWTRKINAKRRPRNIKREMKVAKQNKQPFKLVEKWLRRAQCENMKSQLFSAGCQKYSVGLQKGKIKIWMQIGKGNCCLPKRAIVAIPAAAKCYFLWSEDFFPGHKN